MRSSSFSHDGSSSWPAQVIRPSVWITLNGGGNCTGSSKQVTSLLNCRAIAASARTQWLIMAAGVQQVRTARAALSFAAISPSKAPPGRRAPSNRRRRAIPADAGQ